MDACVSFRPLHLAPKISSLRIRRDRKIQSAPQEKMLVLSMSAVCGRALFFLSLRPAQDYFYCLGIPDFFL